MEENTTPGFSPFDLAVKSPDNKQKPLTDNTGLKIETISETELDGKKEPGFSGGMGSQPNAGEDIPKDVPEFKIPNIDTVPNGEVPPGGGSFGGGSGSGNGPGGPGSGTGQGTKVPEDFSKEFSGFMAKWLVDVFFKLLLMALRSYSKIDKSQVLKAVNEGYIEPRFVKIVDEINTKIENKIEVTEDEKKFVIEPLKYYLEVKKINIKPEYMFMGGLLMVSVGVGFRAYEAKKESKQMLDQIIKESAKIREEARQRAEGKMYTGPKENVETFEPSETNTFSVQNDNPEPSTSAAEEILEFPASSVEEVSDTNA